MVTREEAAREARGRHARAVTQIPPTGWWDILCRTWRGFNQDSLLMVARSIAFSAMMALFPSLAAFISLYGLFADPGKAGDTLAVLTGVLPADVLTLIGAEMVRISAEGGSSLSLTFALGLLLSFWAASTGMKALIRGLNIAYEEEERRSFLVLSLTGLLMTLAAIGFTLVTAAALVVAPIALRLLGAPPEALSLSQLRWPALFVLSVAALQLLYRYAPCRAHARWLWLSLGAVLASLLWLGGSLLFSWYIGAFASFNATYGSLGAVFGFLTWAWLSSAAVLLGAKLNAEIEHQTCVDTTTGPELPMGRRGAVMADTVGRSAGAGPVSLLRRAALASAALAGRVIRPRS